MMPLKATIKEAISKVLREQKGNIAKISRNVIGVNSNLRDLFVLGLLPSKIDEWSISEVSKDWVVYSK